MSTRSYRLADLARLVGGQVVGDDTVEIRGIAGIREARAGDITFIANSRYESYLASTDASAIIADPRVKTGKPLIHADNPHYAYLQVLELFAEALAVEYPRGVHESAVVEPGAVLGENVSIGPFCHIGRDSRVGDGTTILAGACIGTGVTIGSDCLFYGNVTIRERSSLGDRVILQPGVVIGSDGFGFAKNGQEQHKVPQIGRVVIEDDVEIGANSCVDRATTGETIVRRGTKIDNLVQIAHNVVVGENGVLAAHVGIAGSTELGRNVTMGGQAGAAGHIHIGDHSVVASGSGATRDVPPATVVSGFPAREHNSTRRMWARSAQLPELFARVKELERLIKELREGATVDSSAENDS